MDNDRLQEIKAEWKIPKEHTPFSSFEQALLNTLNELITALEEAQAELAECKKLNWSHVADLRNVRAQLAEADEDAETQHEVHVMLIEDAVSKYEVAQDKLKASLGGR